MEQAFLSDSSLRRQLRVSDLDFTVQSRLPGYSDIDELLVATKHWVNSRAPATLTTARRRGRLVYCMGALEQRIAIRALGAAIVSRLPRPPISRYSLSRALLSYLNSTQAMRLVRMDIKNFFLSVDAAEIAAKVGKELLMDSITGSTLLRQLAAQCAKLTGGGLAPGVPISTALAESALIPLDSSMQSRREIWFYGRFVDDIVVIAAPEIGATEVIERVESHLPNGATIHREGKFTDIVVPSCRSQSVASSPQRLEFLGYQFQIGNQVTSGNEFWTHRSVNVELSDAKVSRSKTRMVRAFLDFARVRNFPLLVARIAFLSANPVFRDYRRRSKQRTGLRRTHPLLQHGGRESLSELDKFLHQLISRKMRTFTPTQALQLRRLSFVQGFELRIPFECTPTEIAKIRECWRGI